MKYLFIVMFLVDPVNHQMLPYAKQVDSCFAEFDSEHIHKIEQLVKDIADENGITPQQYTATCVETDAKDVKYFFSQYPAYNKVWGTMRALIANMIFGVTEGFEKKLEVEGIGYRATLVDKNLELLLGFSHPVKVVAPESIEFKVEKNTITVSGISKDLVGRTASSIRALKKPEPYKGKGIHYVGEIIRRKAGKKASTTT